MENRKHTRIEISLEAELLLADGAVIPAQTKNMSFGGVRLLTELPLLEYQGQNCQCSLILMAEPERIAIELQCLIIRTTEDGGGLEFKTVDMDSYYHFKELMVNNASDPKKLLDELEHHPGLEKV